MATFAELQSQLLKMRARREVLLALISYIDSDFQPPSGSDKPKKLILIEGTNDKVSKEDFDIVAADIAGEVEDLDASIKRLLETQVAGGK